MAKEQNDRWAEICKSLTICFTDRKTGLPIKQNEELYDLYVKSSFGVSFGLSSFKKAHDINTKEGANLFLMELIDNSMKEESFMNSLLSMLATCKEKDVNLVIVLNKPIFNIQEIAINLTFPTMPLAEIAFLSTRLSEHVEEGTVMEQTYNPQFRALVCYAFEGY